jgi:hypothetical protein
MMSETAQASPTNAIGSGSVAAYDPPLFTAKKNKNKKRLRDIIPANKG